MIKYHPKLDPNRDTLITNMYMAPFCSIHYPSLFYNLLPFAVVAHLFDGWCFVVIITYYHLLAFGLDDLNPWPTRGGAIFASLVASGCDLLHLRSYGPELLSDRHFISLRRTTCSHCVHQSFVRKKQIKAKTRNLPHATISRIEDPCS